MMSLDFVDHLLPLLPPRLPLLPPRLPEKEESPLPALLMIYLDLVGRIPAIILFLAFCEKDRPPPMYFS